MTIPKLCKGCEKSKFFKNNKTCWYYWAGKKQCSTRQWLDKEGEWA